MENPIEYVATYTRKNRNTAKEGSFKHLMYCPFTGLGLYDGFRGNRWLKNRIKVFKQYVIPSLQAQTSKDFTLWISWRREEKHNHLVKELQRYLDGIKEFRTFHTFSGVCFWDDKYPDDVARQRLLEAIQGSAMEALVNETEGEHGFSRVYMTIQPSDDCYLPWAIERIQQELQDHPDLGAVGFRQGYICNYRTLATAEWNPKTTPPFYTVNFPRPDFIDPIRHAQHTSLKRDVGPYKAGTPIPSHEYVGDALKYKLLDDRGFLVGVHGSNISTVFDHPYAGEGVQTPEWITKAGTLDVKYTIRARIFDSLPYKVKRKLRYLAGEKKWVLRPVFALIYNGLRS